MVFPLLKHERSLLMKMLFNFLILTIRGDEDRFILLGISHKLRVLVVCHCFRKSETVIRIFSARKADKDEEIEYWRNRK